MCRDEQDVPGYGTVKCLVLLIVIVLGVIASVQPDRWIYASELHDHTQQNPALRACRCPSPVCDGDEVAIGLEETTRLSCAVLRRLDNERCSMHTAAALGWPQQRVEALVWDDRYY